MKYPRIVKPLLSVSFLLMVLTVLAQDDEGWKLKKIKDGITIYTRMAKGSKSKFKEYKAETLVQASTDRVLEVLTNTDRYSKWMAGIKETRLLKKENDSTFYIYARLSVPWPFNDRDEISKSVIYKDSIHRGYFMTIKLISGYLPKIKGVVRMTDGNGYWLLEPKPGGKTRVVQQFIVDPGGNMPAWIVNIFLVDSPYKSLSGLKKEVEIN